LITGWGTFLRTLQGQLPRTRGHGCNANRGPRDGLKVFPAYFDLARYIQTRYRMEPSGSMGMWNLADYQFVAVILRAAQLSQGAWVKPTAIDDPEMAEML
jgi:hypothetical protein